MELPVNQSVWWKVTMIDSNTRPDATKDFVDAPKDFITLAQSERTARKWGKNIFKAKVNWQKMKDDDMLIRLSNKEDKYYSVKNNKILDIDAEAGEKRLGGCWGSDRLGLSVHPDYVSPITETINESEFVLPKVIDPEIFFGRWFLSRKKSIPKDWINQLAQKYPYSGKAFRLDSKNKPSGAPLTSWCRTTMGLIQWKLHKGVYRTPPDMNDYVGTITKGVDLAKFVKETGAGGKESGALILQVEEVFPIVTVTDMKPVY